MERASWCGWRLDGLICNKPTLVMPADELTLALQELRAARERHCAVLTGRTYVVGHSITAGARTILLGLRTVAQGVRELTARPQQGVLRHTYERVAEAHPVDPGMMYEIKIGIKSAERDMDAACLLTIEYADAAGQPVGWEETGASFSEGWGFYRYLPASRAGTTSTITIEPPEGSVTIRLDIVRWDQRALVTVEHTSVKAIDTSRKEQLTHYRDFLQGPASTLKDITIVVDSAGGAQSLVDAELGVRGSIIYVYGSRSLAPTPRDRLFLISRSLFDSEYRTLAAVGSGSRRLILTDAAYSSVLQANFFRYAGWQINLNGTVDGSALRARYLRRIEDDTQATPSEHPGTGVG